MSKIRQQFEDEFDKVMASLEKLKRPDAAASPDAVPDMPNLKPLLDELDHLLESGNIRALAHTEKIRRMLPEECREISAWLAESVENYDFEAARTILEKMVSSCILAYEKKNG